MKKLRIILIAVFAILTINISTFDALADVQKTNNKIIRVGSSGTYYPFTFMEGNEVQGFEVDIWNEIGKRLNYKIDYKTASFSGLFGMLDSDKIDVIANQITITDERKEKYYFSDPYVESGAQIIVKEGNSLIKSIDDLSGKSVGVDLGSNYEKLLKEKNVGDSIITYQSTDSEFNDLIIGRIDAVVIDKISALINKNEKNLPLQLAGDPLEKIENAFVFRKTEENEKLVRQVNKVLTDMKEDGTLQEISNKWISTDVTTKSNNSFFENLFKGILSGLKVTILLSVISMVIALILGIIIAVVRYLKISILSEILAIYVSFFRGTPLLVQLFLLYFGLPQIFTIFKGVNGFTATLIALALNASAYISEVLRGSFNAVDKGQMEAALSIGMTNMQAIRRIILPQVIRISIPAIGNIYIDIVKGSSLAFTIGVAEMLAKAQMVASINYKFFESYIGVAIVYWILIEMFNYIQRSVERRLSVY